MQPMKQERTGDHSEAEAANPIHEEAPVPTIKENVASHAAQVGASQQENPQDNERKGLAKIPQVLLSIIEHPKSIAVFGFVLFLCTLIEVGIVGFQYRLSEKEAARSAQDSIEAGEQTDRLIKNADKMAAALRESVAQAKIALDTSLSQSKTALDASITVFRDEQRAWVIPQNVAILSPFNAGEAPSFRVSIKNHGKTPAVIKLVVRTVVATATTADQLIADNSGFEEGGTYLIGPSDILDATPEITAPLPEIALSKMNEGIGRFFVIGRISYSDFAGRSHMTRFCFYIDKTQIGAGNMFVYEKGNSAD